MAMALPANSRTSWGGSGTSCIIVQNTCEYCVRIGGEYTSKERTCHRAARHAVPFSDVTLDARGYEYVHCPSMRQLARRVRCHHGEGAAWGAVRREGGGREGGDEGGR